MAFQTGWELNGLAVVTLADGQRIGRVYDVVFRVDGRIVGFLLMGQGGERFLPGEQVHSLGVDALTLETQDGLLPVLKAPSGQGEYAARSLHGRPVICEAGTVLGKIADIGIDTTVFQVTQLLMNRGFLNSLMHHHKAVPIDGVRAIGDYSIVVSDDHDPVRALSAPVVATETPAPTGEARSQ